MSTQAAISRYMVILDVLRRKKFADFKCLKKCLSEKGFDLSSRTLQRIIEELRNEFNIDPIPKFGQI